MSDEEDLSEQLLSAAVDAQQNCFALSDEERRARHALAAAFDARANAESKLRGLVAAWLSLNGGADMSAGDLNSVTNSVRISSGGKPRILEILRKEVDGE